MPDYHAKRGQLRTAFITHLRVVARTENIPDSPALDEMLHNNAEKLLDEFDQAVLAHHRDTTKRGCIAYFIGVSQSVVAAIGLTLLFGGIAAAIKFSSGKSPFDLAIKVLQRMKSTQEEPSASTDNRRPDQPNGMSSPSTTAVPSSSPTVPSPSPTGAPSP